MFSPSPRYTAATKDSKTINILPASTASQLAIKLQHRQVSPTYLLSQTNLGLSSARHQIILNKRGAQQAQHAQSGSTLASYVSVESTKT